MRNKTLLATFAALLIGSAMVPAAHAQYWGDPYYGSYYGYGYPYGGYYDNGSAWRQLGRAAARTAVRAGLNALTGRDLNDYYYASPYRYRNYNYVYPARAAFYGNYWY